MDNAATRNAKASISRIALVVDRMTTGGKERVVMHLAAEFAAAGLQPLIICLRDLGSLGEQLARDGFAIQTIGSFRGWDLAAILRLRKVLWAFLPNVINVHDYHSLPYAAAAVGMSHRCPVVLSCHGLLLQQRKEGAKFYHRWTARRAAAVTAVSESAARDYTEFLGLAAPPVVIENGVPDQVRQLSLGQRIRHELGIADGVILFVAIGNMKPEKGYEHLVDAAHQLCLDAAGSPFVIAIAGEATDRPYRDRLETQIARLRLESVVRLLGHRSDTTALYSAADAFVLSSRSEGLPMVLLEAMSAGLPVVATAVGGIPTVLKGSGAGLLVEPGRPGALAEGMGRLLRDSTLRKDLGRRAANIARKDYSAAAMAGRYLDLYRRVAGTEGGHE